MTIEQVYNIIGRHIYTARLRYGGDKIIVIIASTTSEAEEKATDSMGEEHTCYVLSSLQKKHPMGPRRAYHHFDVETLEHIVK